MEPVGEARPGDEANVRGRASRNLEFLKPFRATSAAEFTFKPDGNQTIVTWSMAGKNNFMAIGTRAVAGGGPILRDTIFRIASLTKPIAAAATMILVEECKLRLDEPVDRAGCLSRLLDLGLPGDRRLRRYPQAA